MALTECPDALSTIATLQSILQCNQSCNHATKLHVIGTCKFPLFLKFLYNIYSHRTKLRTAITVANIILTD